MSSLGHNRLGSMARVVMCVGLCCISARGEGFTLGTELVVSGLTRPIFVTHAPGDTTRIFVIEKAGRIKTVNLTTLAVATFLDIDERVGGGTFEFSEQGLLGLALHPNFSSNGFFYVNYTNVSGDTRISRFSVNPPDAPAADSGSEVVLLEIDQPFSNHNGGWMAFGPNDGLLYVATGDGGSGCDPDGHAQTIVNDLLGKILRIDVDGNNSANGLYGIPPDNPFVGVIGDDEIWAYGLRNPWRCSFDRLTGDLYIADVGQNTIEEINFQATSSGGGENYGWDCMEGTVCSDVSSGCLLSGCVCGAGGLVGPVHIYNHNDPESPCSITGGYVYRGCEIPELQGTYFFADYCSDQVWSFRYDGVSVTEFTERTAALDPPGLADLAAIASFGEDANGELYFCDQAGGEIFRLVRTDGGGPPDGACFDSDPCTQDFCDAGACTNPPASGTSCDDADDCTVDDACVNGSCVGTPVSIPYGDIVPPGGNGVVDVDDILCTLAGFANVNSCPDADLFPCGGNGIIDVDDILEVLRAFSDIPSCPDPCP